MPMTDPDLESQTQGALAYEELFVPALFREWAPRLIEGAKIGPGHRVLDVACGTGIVAREASQKVGKEGSVIGLDLNAGMLAVAAQRAPRVSWKMGSAESLPFEDGSFDAVCCQFGLMFFVDREAALKEMLRVLARGGHLAVAVWDRLENNPGYATFVAILERVAGDRAAAALRFPFVLGDKRELAALLKASGVEAAQVTTQRGTARFPSIRVMGEADLRGWLPLVGVILPDEQIQQTLAAAEQELRPFAAPDGKAVFDVSAHLVVARRV
jgi:SAM-dependent methyltransferase